MDKKRAKEVLEEYQRRQKRKELLAKAPTDLLSYIEYVKDDYVVSWHHKALCDRLTRLKDEKSKKIIITIGPQRGKSEIVSRKFGLWWLGNFPSAKIIMSSYSAELSNSFNRDAQHTASSVSHKEVFPDLETGHENKNLTLRGNDLETGKGGHLYSVGVGGTTTGKSAGSIGKSADPGLFIIDDPTKDLAEAFSEVKRQSIKEWFQSVVSTRIHGTSHVIVTHTRWHSDDLAGWLIDNNQDGEWEVFSFPELGPDTDYPNPYDPRTKDDEPLWPSEKGGYNELMKIKAAVGDYVWAALYQGKPRIAGGNIVKEDWIQYYTQLPFEPSKLRSSQLIQGWDLTFKKTTDGSYVVGATFARYESQFYLLDFYRKRVGIGDTMKAIKQMSERWPRCRQILVEEKANGSAILELLKKQVSGMIPVLPNTSKDERLVAVAPFFEAGNVYLPDMSVHTKDIVEELTAFPSAPNDDIVDCFSMILDRFSGLKGKRHLEAMSRAW